MHAIRRVGFTLVELLVVIAVIAILAAVSIPAVLGAFENARGTTATNKMAEVAKGSASYAAANREYLPLPAKDQGSVNPAFGTATGEEDVWYNGLAQHLSIRPLSDLKSSNGADVSGFYSSSSVYFLPGARYKKATLESGPPQFAFGMNVNLANWTNGGEKRIKGTIVSVPGKTVLFAEGGIPGERTPSSLVKDGYTPAPSYRAPCAVEPKDYVARYKSFGVIAFGDNHVERVSLDKIVTTSFSQQKDRNKTDISWETDGSDLP